MTDDPHSQPSERGRVFPDEFYAESVTLTLELKKHLAEAVEGWTQSPPCVRCGREVAHLGGRPWCNWCGSEQSICHSDECGAVRFFPEDPHHPCHCGMSHLHVGKRHTCHCGKNWLNATAPARLPSHNDPSQAKA